MRKTIAILSIFATSMVAGAALAQAPEGAPASGVAADAMPDFAAAPAPLGPRLILGLDTVFQNPVSSKLRDGDKDNKEYNGKGATDLGLGVLVRAEYVLRPRLNLTARAGYIYSLQKAHTLNGNKIKNTVDNIPVWVGGKFFFLDKIYCAAELGLNMLTISSERTAVDGSNVDKNTATSGEYKVGMNVGAGVLLKPIDIRAQLEVLDLAKTGDSMALLITAGFNILPW